jgi:hypothetical protein
MYVFFENVARKGVSLKSDNNNWYLIWRQIYIFDRISLSSSYIEKCFGHNLYGKSKHVLSSRPFLFEKLTVYEKMWEKKY